jgi:glutathione synthase
MKIGFVVNDLATEKSGYTTVRLAMAAARRGHETWMMGVGDFTQQPDGTVEAHAGRAPGTRYRTEAGYLKALQQDAVACPSISVDELDVLVLRNDPAEDQVDRPWAVTSGVLFAQLAAAHGTLVVNDPTSLANAVNKTYFQHFPEIVRPRTLISRDAGDIASFIADLGGAAVLKPLQGSGGANVFFVTGGESANVNQMIDAVSRDGYIVTQEVLPEAELGDVRMFLLNGAPLVIDGEYAAFRRVSTTTDRRSNMSVGGKAQRVKVTTQMLDVAEAVRPKLVEDGMFLVGLDIVGDKLMEVNVFSPGGLGVCETLYEKRFIEHVVDALESKVDARLRYGSTLGNTRLATL